MDVTSVSWMLVVFIGCAHGYSSGAPSGSCDSMVPKHRAQVQVKPSPYTISTSATNYTSSCPGNSTTKTDQGIKVTLGGSTAFVGFMCQARPDAQNYVTSGDLIASGSIPMTNKCDQKGAITHTEKSAKQSVEFVWQPSGNDTVYIVCTFVQNKETFWVKQVSDAIQYLPSDCSPSGAVNVLPGLSSIVTCLFICIFLIFKDKDINL